MGWKIDSSFCELQCKRALISFVGIDVETRHAVLPLIFAVSCNLLQFSGKRIGCTFYWLGNMVLVGIMFFIELLKVPQYIKSDAIESINFFYLKSKYCGKWKKGKTFVWLLVCLISFIYSIYHHYHHHCHHNKKDNSIFRSKVSFQNSWENMQM